MKNEIKTLIAIIATVTAMTANAGYSMYVPLEKSSIAFTGAVEDITEEKSPAELCDEKVEIANNYIAANYADVSYKSHVYGEYWGGFPVPVLANGCQITFNLPRNRSYSCIGNNNYAEQVAYALTAIGFDVAEVSYYGTCS